MSRPVNPTLSRNIKKKLQNEMTVRLGAVNNAANRNASWNITILDDHDTIIEQMKTHMNETNFNDCIYSPYQGEPT